MGRAKELLMEMEGEMAQDYRIPSDIDKDVCAEHFDNAYLKGFIIRNGRDGKCSYCGKRGIVMKFQHFMEYAAGRITEYVGPSDQECLPLANSFFDKDDERVPGVSRLGCYAVPDEVETYDSVDELMDDFDISTDNIELNKDIASCFHVNLWIRKDPMGLRKDDELKYDWGNFSRLVKTKCRFTFFRDDEYYAGGAYAEGFSRSDILVEISVMVKKTERIISKGARLFRGRPADGSATFTKFSELTSPPSACAKENRMSPYGISMFYGSFDPSTPLAEINNYADSGLIKIYLGEFVTTKDLKVIDLCSLPMPDFWMETQNEWLTAAFLHRFHDEITKPIGKNDGMLEYIPTQVFAEYLRRIQKSGDGTSYDGIVYRSSLTGKSNIVLFYDNKTSADILELICVKAC